jgi:hypothetical protein
MKSLIHALKFLLALALLALAAGCASSSKGTQDLAIAAGFKVITPVNPEQKALLQTLPEGKITQITHDGKLYYVLPDAPNNQAYVGGPQRVPRSTSRCAWPSRSATTTWRPPR